MARSNASTEAMDRMIRNITKFMQNQDALIGALRRDYSSIGGEWNDPKYEQLGTAINDAIVSISSSTATLSETITKLQLLKGKLEEYLAQQI